ncbi:putative conserved glutamic acid-rich protein [Diaporthe ampelina]|uniref:Putative conserved glutamic acid-rich protein n=1 Tax=Diaporthe ampelina TaxID=1214573 RepID=A0A0G2FZ12_9PEZI|nr:putative conserved glutamic acid-rich protein [Diaporthe ampelina]
MMEAVAEDQGHLEADKKVGFEDDTVSAIQDEEFDFDIGGPGDNLEEALDGLESTHDDLTYHTENDGIIHDARTHSIQDQGAQEALDEYREDGIPGQDQDQHGLEVPAFDASVDAEGVDQAYQLDVARGDQAESEIAQQALDAQYGEGEKYQEVVYLEDTAEELGSFVDVGQQNEELAQSTTVATESVEFSHLEEEHFEDIHDEVISAEEVNAAQSVDETQPPVESNYVDEMTKNETTVAATHSEGVAQDTSLEQESYLVGTTADQNTTDTGYGLDDAGDQEMESSKISEQHPRVRVSYGSAEFYLFAESPDADPDDYFFQNADVLRQPLSQFLPKLRQVVSEDLQPSDELFVKVDGLGLEFGEATTKDFLEHTTFGQVLELYDRLVKLDDGSSEAPELYLYLETRPNCLHRITELANNANEGKGLSQVAFYYEGTSDLAAIEEESNDYDEGRQGVNSDDVSDEGSNDQIEGDLSASHESEQPYNPFRLSESQQQAMDASHSSLADGEVVDDSLSADADKGHAAYAEDDNDESFSGEVQGGLELAATEDLRDVSAAGAQQDTDMVPDEDEDFAAEATNDESEGQRYGEEDLPGREETAGTEANADTENEDFHEDDGPTDDYDTAENDDYLDIGAAEEEPAGPAEYAASAGTPEPASHDSSATATLDGEGQGHGDDVSATQALADAVHPIQTPSQLEPGPPETQTDEIHWNDDDDDENDNDNDEVDIANQNQTNLSPSSLSVKRGRQADGDDVGLGDDSIAKRRRT